MKGQYQLQKLHLTPAIIFTVNQLHIKSAAKADENISQTVKSNKRYEKYWTLLKVKYHAVHSML